MEKYTKVDKAILWINKILLVLAVISILIPLIYVFIASFMDPSTLLTKGISFNPSEWSLAGYKKIFEDQSIVRGFMNSMLYSTAFTLITVVITIFAAYPLAQQDFVGKKAVMTMFIITMFFNGG